MGDGGSLLLGLLLAWCAIGLAMGERPALAPITAVWILGVPIADTVTLMIRRALRGRSPFAGDREHLHHILLALGLSTGHSVLVMGAASLALTAIALLAQDAGVPEYVMFYLYVAGLVAHGVAAEVLCRRLGLRR
jgi:UDP-GlcNAc:undecaprenyl-phosphate GlcNAc-1-phosphate transferase